MSDHGGVQRRGRYWGGAAPDTYKESDSIPSLDGGWVQNVKKDPESAGAQIEPAQLANHDAGNTAVSTGTDDSLDDSSHEPDSLETDLLIESEIEALKAARTELGLSEDEDLNEVPASVSLSSEAAMQIEYPDNQMESVVKQIVATLQRNFDEDKRRFQNAMQTAFRHRVSQIEKKANHQLRKRLEKVRLKDKALIVEKERRLAALIGQLEKLVKEVSAKKASVEKTSREFEQKLAESDLVQNELHDLGRTLSQRARELGNAMVDDRKSSRSAQDRGSNIKPIRPN